MPADLSGAWFDARRLFQGGRYPETISSALRVFPNLLEEVRRAIAAIAPRRALEVGPGDCAAIEGLVPRPVYLDLVAGFLRGKAGGRVLGDLRRAPFSTGAFDLVVANDVFTHIPPAERPGAVAEIARLAPRALIFNPEPGTPEVAGSPVPTGALVDALAQAGLTSTTRRFVAHAAAGPYHMAIVSARRVPPASA